MKKRKITQYNFYTRYNVLKSLLGRLRKNKNIETNTLNRLCNILHCDVAILWSIQIFLLICADV